MSTIAARLSSKSKRAKNGCLIFTGALSRGGYGNIYTHSAGGKTFVTGAHRAAYEVAIGPIQDGLHVLHLCDNPACIEPSHLFLGTQATNMQDKSSKGRAISGPPSRSEWWTSEMRDRRRLENKNRNAIRRRRAAESAGYPPNWIRCPTCTFWKSPDSFGKNKARHTGLQGQCKACKNAANDERRVRKTARRCAVYRSDKIHF